MWVRLEVTGHIRILAQSQNAVRALQASLWLFDPTSASQSLCGRKTLKLRETMISTSNCYGQNCKVRTSIAYCSLVHRLDLPGFAQPLFIPLQIPTQAEYRDVEPLNITAVGAERQTLDLMLCVYCCIEHCLCSNFHVESD